jgi:hypothetical protein
MKKALLVLLVLSISAALVATVFAQAPAKSAPATQKAPAAPVIHMLTGQVTAVDAAAKMLEVKGSKKEVKFDVANAKWTGYKAIDEVKAGDKVTVKYTEKEGKMTANQVLKAVPKAETKKK